MATREAGRLLLSRRRAPCLRQLLRALEPACPELYNFRFAAGKTFKEKLVRLAEVLGVENPERNMKEVLEWALDLALERKDPQKRHERRLERERKRGAPSGEPCPGESRQ